jgi:hypothetical protein
MRIVRVIFRTKPITLIVFTKRDSRMLEFFIFNQIMAEKSKLLDVYYYRTKLAMKSLS